MGLYMINTRDLVLKLRNAREKKGLSLDKVLILMEANGQYISKTTLSRVFRKGSEECSFSYERTLRPLASVLFEKDMLNGEDHTSSEFCINAQKQKYERDTAYLQGVIKCLEEQIVVKDNRIDKLLELYLRQMDINLRLTEQIIQNKQANNKEKEDNSCTKHRL